MSFPVKYSLWSKDVTYLGSPFITEMDYVPRVGELLEMSAFFPEQKGEPIFFTVFSVIHEVTKEGSIPCISAQEHCERKTILGDYGWISMKGAELEDDRSLFDDFKR